MNHPRLLPDDPRLTAYAVGELAGPDRAAVEAALRRDPALRAQVEELRATAALLASALAAEAEEASAAGPALAPVVPINGQVAVAPEPDRAGSEAGDGDAWRYEPRSAARRGGRGRRTTFFTFPRFYYLAGGLAAAGLAVMVALYRDTFDAKERVRAETLRLAMERRDAVRTVEVQLPVFAPAPTVDPASGALGLLAQVQGAGTAGPARVDALPSAPGDMPPPSANDGAAKRGPAAEFATVGATPPGRSGAGESVSGARIQSAGLIAAAGDGRLAGLGGGRALAGGGLPGSVAPARGGALDRVARDLSGVGFARAAGDFQFAPGLRALDGMPVPGGRGLDLFGGPRAGDPATGAGAAKLSAPGTEAYAAGRENPFLRARLSPLSTFGVDVDTASYSRVRSFIERRQLPPSDAVRIEELVNYFPYRYAPPAWAAAAAAQDAGPGAPFSASLEVAEAPWAPTHRLVRIGLKGREVAAAERPAANLVFLLDISGSMGAPNRLPLVKHAMRQLVAQLRGDDRVAIVTYAGNSGLALPSTPAGRAAEIFAALESLQPGGSTDGERGIQLAYEIAKANYATDGLNRVILCTDGDFNVGVTGPGELVRLVEAQAKTKVFLTVLGFGMGDFKDATLELLADKGNGHYGYIDSEREARKILVDEVTSTLATIAKDVKVQVEFNPAKVASYRLIGYENRALHAEDFADDDIDAGEIGAGHTVTALYEVVPVGAEDEPAESAADEEFRYRPAAAKIVPAAVAGELLTVRLRYKDPAGAVSRKVEFPLVDRGGAFAKASPDFRFAAAVAEYGMILRGSPHRGKGTLGDVLAWAAAALAHLPDDPGGYRGEFIDLVRKTQTLME